MEPTFEKRLERLVEASLDGRDPGRDELLWLLQAPDERTLDIVAAVSRVRFAAFGRRVKLNLLLNIKSGLCPEDCHYCSQARDSEAPILSYPMVGEETFCAAATRARELGATRLCLVASGRGPTEREVEQVARGVEAVKAADGAMEICACLGLLGEGQAERLGEAGVYAYNHNLNTSEEFYGEICDTHTFADRQETVERARGGGLSPCSGALFGMGESDEDVLEAGYALRAIEPDSVPVNFLSDLDSTGGNSGSATMDADGNLVGLLFDGTIESVNSDWDFDPRTTRTIHVDTRYMLWVMEKLDNAGHIVDEMTLTTTR